MDAERAGSLVLTDQALQVLAMVAPAGIRQEFWVAHDLGWRGGCVRADLLGRLAMDLARLCEEEAVRHQVCWVVSPWGLFAARDELDRALAVLHADATDFVKIRVWDVMRDGAPPPFRPTAPRTSSALFTPAVLPIRQAHNDHDRGEA